MKERTPETNRAKQRGQPKQWRPLKRLTPEEVAALSLDDLRHYCRSSRLHGDGDEATLRRRIETLLWGDEKRHQHGRTRCKHCGARLKVVKTRRFEGSRLVQRYVQCEGRPPLGQKHRYALDPAPAAAAE